MKIVILLLICMCISHAFRCGGGVKFSKVFLFMQDDFISRIFRPFIPTPEDIGLKRFNQTSRPENFPCVKDKWADLLPEDKRDTDTALLRPMLCNTNLQYRPLRLAYDANRDGWKASAFHSKIDKNGPAIVLARSRSGGVFGGYNPTGWVNYGEYRGSIAAFLFVFLNGDTNTRPIKLAKISGAGLAQIDDGSGPKFGMEGLTIALDSRSNPRLVRSKLGLYYEKLPNLVSVLPGNKPEDELSEVKVYVGVYQQGEKVPYSDALPYQLN